MTSVTALPDSPSTSQIWRHRELLHRDLPGKQVGETLRDSSDCLAWIFLPRRESAALHITADHLGLDSLALEDVLTDDEGTKLEWIGSSMVAVTAYAQYQVEAAELQLDPVSLLADRRVLVIMVADELRPLLTKALEKAKAQILEDGIPAALHAVMDALVDSYSAVLRTMQDNAEDLSEKLFEDRPLVRAEQLRAFQLRRALAQLRRVTTPMRDITAGLANAARGREGIEPTDPAEKLLGTRSGREYSDVADHAVNVSTTADVLREEIASMYETNLSLADVHLNFVMKKLTGWAAIIAVPTLITGFMGMNVPYPGFSTRTGFLVAAVVMVAAVSFLFIMFKRKDWI